MRGEVAGSRQGTVREPDPQGCLSPPELRRAMRTVTG